MAASLLVDAGFLVSLLHDRDSNHDWAVAEAKKSAPPWQSCEAVLSETFHLLGRRGTAAFAELISRRAIYCSFRLADELDGIVDLMRKYEDVPMSFADACLVRMTELLPNPVVLTTDSDFHIYRRHGRRTIPCVLPS